ncbi:EAL domain-containing protein [Acidithrix ferrooxidans]|uniref:Cyclic di-GMP phosphodiesterase Gmr n=1 Tax=Acidithrix ferrooxidans TaxID=1280514 RepID=A0A0D8HKA1_9ACTN|nr:EAL domain-containing protein [Acidithrix ferrooxidans]KJF17526.1 cyclic di-GMP phosphodiesterase Gmr [Acidithrix ferrooxidans]
MPCRECGTFCVPEQQEFDRVLLSVPSMELLILLEESMRRGGFDFEVNGLSLKHSGADSVTALQFLACQANLSDFQQREIQLLTLRSGEEVTFDVMRGVQSLDKYRRSMGHPEVRKCLENKRIETHFQPVVEIASQQLHGFEALSRGRNETGEIISPTVLFEYARANDAVFFLDRLARETAIRTAAELELPGRIFINFLPNAIYDPRQCLRTTLEIADEANFDPSRIVFEVTETERIEDMDHLGRIFDYYRHNGFKVALDDVGSGYAGLNTLIDLSPDIIKVDREIIIDIDRNPLKQSIFRGLATAAREQGIEVVAEGIETKEEFAFVAKNGATLAQGFLFAKPMRNPPTNLTWPNPS